MAPGYDEYEQIFGRDSDSELSDEEGPKLPRAPPARAQRSASRSASPDAGGAGGSFGGGDEDGDDEDGRNRDFRSSVGRDDDDGGELPSFRKKSKKSRDDGEEVVQRKKKRRKTTPPPAGEEDMLEETPLTESELKRRNINAQIDAALKSNRKRVTKKRAGEEDLDIMADEEVSALRQQMIIAADEDEDANKAKRPGTSKLKLLPKVVNTLQKTHLQQSILDNNLLEGVKRWLEPLPDKSLPALNIQRQFFAILEKMQIDTISLKMSGLGKVVVFYSMCPRVEAPIRRSADHLIEIWSRPILKRSSSYRDRHVEAAEWRPGESQSQYMPYSQSSSQIDANRRTVNIPQAITSGFRIAPRTLTGASGGDSSHQARLANSSRLNRFKTKLKDSKTKR